MSKRRSKAASQELTFLAALDSIYANVDTSEIAEIRDWSRAVRGKFLGASAKEPSRLSKLKAGLQSALGRPRAANRPASPARDLRRVSPAASGNVASHGAMKYSQMAIPQLITVCTSELSEEAWREFIRRVRPVIFVAIVKVVRSFNKVSSALVDDLVQEAFVKLCHDNYRALKGVATMRDEQSSLSFLKVVATNVAKDHFRNVVGFKAGAAQKLEVLPELHERNASSVIERGILLKEIDGVLKTLSHEPNFERDRAIFWLHYSQGLTVKEIAALPGVTLNIKGVESTLLRLTGQIRVALTQKDKKNRWLEAFGHNLKA